MSQDDGNSNSSGYERKTASSALSEALGQQFGQTAAKLIEKNLDIAPTVEIRPGYQFNVVVTKDITMPNSYQSFDYAKEDSNHE
jgi:type IV secretion system protein VirB10